MNKGISAMALSMMVAFNRYFLNSRLIIHFDLLQLVYQQQSNSGNTELSSDIVEYIIVT